MKKYPFSAAMHAHDIELVKNRAFNLAHEALDAGNAEEYERLMDIHDDANEVLSAVMTGLWESGNGRIAWLDGPMIGRAKELVTRGLAIRDGMNLDWKNGRRA